MLDIVETLKNLLGVTSNAYDFIFIYFSLFLIFYLFVNLLGMLGALLNFVGGKR